MEGAQPDYRGAANFYEAVYHLLTPPPLPRLYWRHNAPPPPNEAEIGCNLPGPIGQSQVCRRKMK